MKIYTRSGDDGTTGLLGGDRVPKSDPRVACTGDIDELNAMLGLTALSAEPGLAEKLQRIQGELFILGAHLATPHAPPDNLSLPEVNHILVERLENEIDTVEKELPELKNFILPGGAETAARLHLARTLCRRAERALVAVADRQSVPGTIREYMNRLSDWLFTHARWSNHRASVKDITWNP